MARLASRRNRRAVGIQANPIPGEVWLTTFSTDGLTYVEFQISGAATVQDTTDSALLAPWVWNFWDSTTQAMGANALTRIQPIDGGMRIYVPGLADWDTINPWALMWPHGQGLVRGVLGEVLTSTAISDAVGTKDNCGLFAAIRRSGPPPTTNWMAVDYVTSANITSTNTITVAFNTTVTGADITNLISVSSGGPLTSIANGVSANEIVLTTTSAVIPGDTVQISPQCGIVGSSAGYPVAPGVFRL